MPPPNGSDSERLMAEIEAYLRTGQGPPAAPEPPSTRAKTRPFDAGAPDGLSGGRAHSGGRRRRGWPYRRWRALRRRLGGGSSHRPWRGVTFSSGSPWARMRARRGSDVPPEPPSWTPIRVVLVVAFVVGLLLIPVIWPQHQGGGSNPDGADHASAAPAAPGYAFLSVNRSGTPVRWNPCTTTGIQYQLDLAGAPPSAQSDIATAIASISQATGIAFDYQGTTNQLPTGQISPGEGAAEPPVVIAWATPQESRSANLPVDLGSGTGPGSTPGADTLAKTVLVASADEQTGHRVYVSGSVVISAAATHLPAGFVPGGDGVLVLHELGRLLGLTDVPADGQVMNPQVLSTPVTALGPGDRAGLKRLGRSSGCLATPANGTLETVF
ncbi:MAG TPA: hypothetical protein VFH58_13195 [Acidimicrobiales bacterium]|nr:hypothetical protein [Acidimicrobiales bacterium]